MNQNRLVLSAISGGSGKTFITTALIRSLTSLGLKVSPFKKGPDFIDPKWLSAAAGRNCYNLDFHLFGSDLLNSFREHSKDSEISIIEGNHGIFDSIDPEGSGSTAHLARILNAPVILIVNCKKLSRTVAPIINGVVGFEKGIQFAGVILNQVAGKRHEEKLREAVSKYCSIPILGCIHKVQEEILEERYLGIVSTEDQEDISGRLLKLEEIGKKSLDLEKIIEAAKKAPSLEIPETEEAKTLSNEKSQVTIAVARDEAFHFYYPDNLRALEENGAELVFFSPLHDKNLPESDGIYLGGGYPELFSDELEENEGIQKQIYNAIEKKIPVYAECGGMMYLCRSIQSPEHIYNMAGTIPADCIMKSRPQGRGYVELKTQSNNISTDWQIPEETTIKAHEFHFSRLENIEENSLYEKAGFAYKMSRGEGMYNHQDGFVYKNLLASYSHLHILSAKWWAQSFVGAAKKVKSQSLG